MGVTEVSQLKTLIRRCNKRSEVYLVGSSSDHPAVTKVGAVAEVVL